MIAESKSHSSLRAILTAACLGFLVVQLDVSVVNVGLGALKNAFGTDLTGLQWVINSYALPFSALLILGGAWGDKWGAKSVFAAGFAIFTFASIGCGLADSMTMLITMRVVQGIGAAFLIPTSLTLIRVSFDPDARRAAVALWGACGGIALAAGPVIGGLMIEYFGWRSVFLLNIPIGLLAVGLILRYAPASPRIDKHVDIPGQISIAICLASLTYGMTESSAKGWVSETLTAIAIATISAAAFVLIERRVKHPMLPAHLAKNKVLGSMALAGAAINLIVLWNGLRFQYLLSNLPALRRIQNGVVVYPADGGADIFYDALVKVRQAVQCHSYYHDRFHGSDRRIHRAFANHFQ